MKDCNENLGVLVKELLIPGQDFVLNCVPNEPKFHNAGRFVRVPDLNGFMYLFSRSRNYSPSATGGAANYTETVEITIYPKMCISRVPLILTFSTLPSENPWMYGSTRMKDVRTSVNYCHSLVRVYSEVQDSKTLLEILSTDGGDKRYIGKYIPYSVDEGQYFQHDLLLDLHLSFEEYTSLIECSRLIDPSMYLFIQNLTSYGVLEPSERAALLEGLSNLAEAVDKDGISP